MTFRVKVRQKTGSLAEAFALERHGDQDHGCLKISEHLRDVAATVAKHYDPNFNISPLEDVVAAAYGHDLYEDTNTTPEEVRELFGDRIEELIELLTDKSGRNRLERHLKTYHAIRRDPDATLIKLADRRHNQQRSIANGEHWMRMYEKEFLYFKFALWTPGKFAKLWDELDGQYDQMKKKMTW